MPRTVNCLSVQQPWANLLAMGRKTLEIRIWRSTYRGPLIICASKTPRGKWPQASLQFWGVTSMPRGVAVATCMLVDVRTFHRDDEADALCGWEPDHYAFVLEHVQPIQPFPVKGALYIFGTEVPESGVHTITHDEYRDIMTAPPSDGLWGGK